MRNGEDEPPSPACVLLPCYIHDRGEQSTETLQRQVEHRADQRPQRNRHGEQIGTLQAPRNHEEDQGKEQIESKVGQQVLA